MKKIGSISLLVVYAISLFQVIVPVLSFHANHEYIKAHLCRSLFEAGNDDCDGFCYLKKTVDEHHGHSDNHQMPETTTPKVPFVYVLSLIQDSKLIDPDLPKIYESFDLIVEQQFYADVSSPPPRF